jgi:hypothetical protein
VRETSDGTTSITYNVVDSSLKRLGKAVSEGAGVSCNDLRETSDGTMGRSIIYNMIDHHGVEGGGIGCKSVHSECL